MRLLRELAHRGTIAAGAQALSYTPSAVSQQLAALEREAGPPLLTRTGRRVSLTPAGAVLVEHAEVVLAELERAEAALAAGAEGWSGSVRLGTFTTALQRVALAAMLGIDRSADNLDLSVTEVDPADVPDLLRGDHLDMALVHEYDNVPSAMGSGIELEPLLDEVVLLASTSTPDGSGIDDFTAVLRPVAAGAGVALVPQLVATEVPAGVTLTALPINRKTRIAYRRGSRSQPVFAAVSAELHRAALAFHGSAAELATPDRPSPHRAARSRYSRSGAVPAASSARRYASAASSGGRGERGVRPAPPDTGGKTSAVARRPTHRAAPGRPPDRHAEPRHRAIHGDHRRRHQPEQHVVQGDDLRPVGARDGVLRRAVPQWRPAPRMRRVGRP
ncbi:LysR family transcriptional regulator [Rhodococcus hoagii]|nr:LysR family transcriptional regulator [Prescottella equi]